MPDPLNESVRQRFRAQRVRDTEVELAIRRAVHRMGLRYRVNVRPSSELRVRADMVFTRAKVAVFIDGCFWHGCPEHFIPPKNNAEWWAAKIQGNRDRDARSRADLVARGWQVVSIWEHANADEAASEIAAVVDGDVLYRSGGGGPSSSP